MSNRSSTDGQDRLRVLDLFSGLGGLSAGLASTGGFDIVAACEIWKPAADSFRHNHPGAVVVEGDLTFEAPKRQVCQPFKHRKCDVVVGGVPCQSYSLAGNQDPEDPRFWLYEQFLEVVKRLTPSAVIIENVVGILTAETPDGARVMGRISDGLHGLGYSVGHVKANAADYGTPQSRERVVIFGWRRGGFPRLIKTHDGRGRRGLPPWRTFRDAVRDLPEKPKDFVRFSPRQLDLLMMLKPGQNWQNLPEEHHAKALGSLIEFPGGTTGCCRRLAWDEPSPTLMTSPTMRKTCLCHPDQHRPLSIQEYTRLQDLPDDCVICGTLSDRYRQLGNAVPVLLGRVIGLAVLGGLGIQPKPQDTGREIVAAIEGKIDKANDLPIHPLALLFPPMPREELDALADDIRKNGLIEDIVMLADKILDGVHRFRACGIAGVKPRFRNWDGEGGTPIRFVMSRNWARRHLTPSQRAAIAVEIEKVFARETVRGRPRKDGKDGKIAIISGTTRDRTAGVATVSARYVQDAKLIARLSPMLIEDVRCGRMTIPEAKREAIRTSGVSGSGETGGSPPTHRVELDVLGQTLRSPTLTEKEATSLAKELSRRIAQGAGISISVAGDNGTVIVPLHGGERGFRDPMRRRAGSSSGEIRRRSRADQPSRPS